MHWCGKALNGAHSLHSGENARNFDVSKNLRSTNCICSDVNMFEWIAHVYNLFREILRELPLHNSLYNHHQIWNLAAHKQWFYNKNILLTSMS